MAAYLDRGRAELERLRGDFGEARRFARRAIDGVGAVGTGPVQGGFVLVLGQLELAGGDPAVALVTLLRSDAILAELGEQSIRSTTQALLADAYERLGNQAAARAAIQLSDELSASQDLLNYVTTQRVRARLALTENDHAAAERFAKSAVQYACRTEFLRPTAEARLDLARVLAALGRQQEAATEARAVLELYRREGDVPGTREASLVLDGIGQWGQ